MRGYQGTHMEKFFRNQDDCSNRSRLPRSTPSACGWGDVFSNLAGNGQYYLNYMPEVGSLTVVHIPEPATATLSLLALAALAARRRRK